MAVINATVLVPRDTTANWNSLTSFIPHAGEVIVYTDYMQKDGQDIPGVKIGDGLAYLVDLPFVTDSITEVTTAERTSWNNKVSARLSGENLIFETSN